MHIDRIPRVALQVGLGGARLPLTIAARLFARGQDSSNWPPILLFDKVEARMKGLVGRATHDDVLQGMARLQHTEVAKREEALTKRARAAQLERDADARAEARRRDLEAEREAIAASNAEREQQVEDAQRKGRQRVAKEAANKRAASRTTAAKRKEAVDTRGARADAQRLRSEAKALRAKEAAVKAQGETLDLDKALHAQKSARRSG